MLPKYQCNSCDYECCKKSCWEQHLRTAKHKNANLALTNANTKYACELCSRTFGHRSSLSRHKRICENTLKIRYCFNNSHNNNDL